MTRSGGCLSGRPMTRGSTEKSPTWPMSAVVRSPARLRQLCFCADLFQLRWPGLISTSTAGIPRLYPAAPRAAKCRPPDCSMISSRTGMKMHRDPCAALDHDNNTVPKQWCCMPVEIRPALALLLLRNLTFALVGDGKPAPIPDFTLRQLIILLIVYLETPPHTVRGLARKIGVTKPVVTRALDTLGKYQLLARRRDDFDRRNVIVQRTVKGALYVETLGDIVVAKA